PKILLLPGQVLQQRRLNARTKHQTFQLADAEEALDLEAIESLAIALLNFSSVDDLESWLAQRKEPR
ncbi:MAG: DUF4351 domain-containing protein, partial [Cyanobacteria bacterium J06576_12]